MVIRRSRAHVLYEPGQRSLDPDAAPAAGASVSLGRMREAVTAERRVLIEEVLLGEDEGGGALILDKPVLIEAGQRYWVSDSDLVVEATDGRRQHFPGGRETRCYRR